MVDVKSDGGRVSEKWILAEKGKDHVIGEWVG